MARSDRSWRLAVGIAGALTFAGGGMHPDSADGASLQEGLAEMTAFTGEWVTGHGLMTAGSAMLVLGLLAVRRAGAWPAAARVLPFALVATAVNTVELVLHTAAVTDHDRLAAGEWPPLTVAHLSAAVVAYPLFGVALVALAWRLLPTWAPPLRAVAAAGMVAGVANALAAPLTVAGVDGANELFPIAGIGSALFLVTAALAGLRSPAGTYDGGSIRMASASQ